MRYETTAEMRADMDRFRIPYGCGLPVVGADGQAFDVDRVTTVTSSTGETLTFREAEDGTLTCEGMGVHHAVSALSGAVTYETIAGLRALTWDCLALLVGWAMYLNEAGGDDREDAGAYPMSQVIPLIRRAKGLGVEP